MADLTQAQQRALELHEKLWNDRTAKGATYRAAAKEAFPDVTTPEDQFSPVVEPLNAKIEALMAQIAERDAKTAEAEQARAAVEAQTSLSSALDNARAKYNLTDAGLDKAVARMKETGNYTDAEAAAAWVAQQTPVPKSPGPYLGPQQTNFYSTMDDPARLELLHTNTEKFLDAELTDFARDPDAYVNDTFGLN